MSLANLYSRGNIYLDNEISRENTMEKLNIKSGSRMLSHMIDSLGKFHLTDENDRRLISFDSSANLDDCALKTHIENQVAPVRRTTTTHTLTLGLHEDRLTTLENLPNTENIAVLQGQINALITYNNKLKLLVLALKESMHLSKSSTDETEFDYTGLI